MYRSAYNSDIQRVTATFHETTPESFFHCFQYPRLEIRRVLPGLALRESRLQVSSSTLRVIGFFMCTLQKPFLFHAAAGHRWSASSASVPPLQCLRFSASASVPPLQCLYKLNFTHRRWPISHLHPSPRLRLLRPPHCPRRSRCRAPATRQPVHQTPVLDRYH
jgi:hypothetical protein